MTRPAIFRHRGREVSRLQGFSDAVFGFALTLLVVSLEVPRSFDQLWHAMLGLPAFAASFAIFLWIWWEHHEFFRRYGLDDGPTVVLNSLLLFVVLFYVYPLKFMFTLLSRMLLGIPPMPAESAVPMIRGAQVPQLMAIYALGFVVVFAIFVALYARAWSRREGLGLDATERYMTRVFIRSHALAMGIGVLSLGLALTKSQWGSALSGLVYSLLGPVLGVHGVMSSRRVPPRDAPTA